MRDVHLVHSVLGNDGPLRVEDYTVLLGDVLAFQDLEKAAYGLDNPEGRGHQEDEIFDFYVLVLV